MAVTDADAPRAALVELFFDGTLRSYAQIIFSRSRLVGGLLLLATVVSPALGLYGLLAVLLANLTARALGFSADSVSEGLYGYNALLVGLGGAAVFEIDGTSGSLLVVAVIATVLVTAAARSVVGRGFGVPILTIPFLAIFYLVLAAGPMAGARLLPSAMPLTLGMGPFLAFPEVVVRSLGSLFFTEGLVAGALVVVALLVHSRSGLILALMGFVGAWVFGQVLYSGSDPILTVILGYNLALTALAIGGIWFVPSRSAFALAAISVAVAGAITVGLLPVMASLGLPLLILPLNIAVPLVLYAMRQRVRDDAPKSVDFLVGTPEENLRFYQSRVARFGSHFALRLRAPFLGKWVVTQGTGGEFTHRGPWRHALDFEVADAAGRTFRGGGHRLADYHCYRLPVLACANGTVVRVIDGVPDNAIGAVDTKHNWGNLIMLYHGPGLYSLVCHLAPGSLKVIEGQYVRQGEVVGLSGSSGRSPVPHLHFHLQPTPAVGAPTRDLELHDVVTGDDEGERLHGTLTPVEGEVVRNLDTATQAVELPGIPLGERLELVHQDGRREGLRFDIDLLGRRVLTSDRYDASLHFDVVSGLFTVYEVLGDRRSALHAFGAALSRVPLEGTEGLVWTDSLDHHPFLRWPLTWLLDLVAPFAPAGGLGLAMSYRFRHDQEGLVILGESRRRTKGRPWLTTEVTLEGSGVGIRCLSITAGPRTMTMRRPETGTAPEASRPAEIAREGQAA